MDKTLLVRIMCAFILSFSIQSVNAALLISDLDLNNLSFEVDDLSSNPIATGTSNGIGFTLTSVSSFFVPNSNTTGSQSYNDLPNDYDDLHLGTDFTINFDQSIDYLLVALANDNDTGSGLNFNLLPSDSVDASINGTEISIVDIEGALVLYEFASPITSITHTSFGVVDGFDTSFFAGTIAIDPSSEISIVPSPAAFWLFASALFSFAGIFKRKKG